MARQFGRSLSSVAPDKAAKMELRQQLEAGFTVVRIPSALDKCTVPVLVQSSPISFLPNEILIQIFRDGCNDIPLSARTLPAVMKMAGVCKSWRAVVHCTPELWTRVFVTSATPADHLQIYFGRSRDFAIDIDLCHWPLPGSDEVAASLQSITGTLHQHAHRLRNLSIWEVSDTTVCAVIKGFLNSQLPCLTSVSIRANHTTYPHYYKLRDLYLLPFLGGRAPSLTFLEMDHFPIETFRMTNGWPFNVQNLTSLALRTQECPTRGFSLPPYLIEFPALCALLRTTPNLTTLALYGPVVEPDEDFPARPPAVTLPSLETLIIHRRDPGVRYHCELLHVLTMPNLRRLEIPWHDDLTAELPYANRAEAYLLDAEGQPRFASVHALYLHDSAAPWQMPTRSLMKAFPNVDEVVLGGTDVARFAATLRGSVRATPASPDPPARRGNSEMAVAGVLTDGAWQMVRKLVLKEPGMAHWRGWVRGFCKWLAAGGHAGPVCVEIRDYHLLEGELDEQGMRAFRRGLDRLRKHAQVVTV